MSTLTQAGRWAQGHKGLLKKVAAAVLFFFALWVLWMVLGTIFSGSWLIPGFLATSGAAAVAAEAHQVTAEKTEKLNTLAEEAFKAELDAKKIVAANRPGPRPDRSVSELIREEERRLSS